MSLLECNLMVSDDNKKLIYSAPYKQLVFSKNQKGDGFYIEVSGYEDSENRISDGHTKKIFFFDEYEIDTIIDWLKHI